MLRWIDTKQKKRHGSEGKQKKSKKKASKKDTSVSVKQEEEKIKPQISIVDRIENEAKKNFFQEMINQKKGLVKEEPVLLRAQKRKKTSIATAFEEKTTNEDSKRNSIVKEELKVLNIYILVLKAWDGSSLNLNYIKAGEDKYFAMRPRTSLLEKIINGRD